MTVLRKSTVRPWPSVSRPSSSSCRSTLKTSACAFSISSRRTHGVRPAAHGLGELPALLVADVAGRRADEPRDRVALLVLGHVEPDHRALVVEHELRERARELGLADAGRAEEDERADRAVRILQPGARAPERVRDRLDGRVLADDALVQPLLHVDELLDLALEQPRDGNARPRRDDGGDVVLVDLLLHHRRLGRLLALARAPARARGGSRSGSPRRARGSRARSSRSASMRSSSICRLISATRCERVLLARPARGELVARAPSPRRARARRGSRTLSRLVRHRGELDLELAHAALGLVELDRRGVDLHPQPRGRLVHEVDRLVRKEPVGDVPVREHRRGDERRVADLDAVVRLVALLQAAQDGDRVRHRGLADEDRLEAPLERRVLLDVLAVLVERRRADRAQLAAREHRLEQVGRVDGALGRAGADDRVQLVDEEDDLARRVLRSRASTALSRSSNSPRYFAPARSAPTSSAHTRLPFSPSGTSPATMRWARPSTIAVLPTPGSPISTGLFFVRRESTWITRRISSSRPMTGSSLPDSASAVRSRPYFSSAWYEPSGSCDVTFCPPRTSCERLQQRVARDEVEGEQEMLDRDELVAERAHLVERAVEHAAETRQRPAAARRRPATVGSWRGAPPPRHAARRSRSRRGRRACAEAPDRGARP